MDNKQRKAIRLNRFLGAFCAILVVVGLRFFLFIPVQVGGNSMMPTIRPEETLFCTRVPGIDRFDIIVFEDSSKHIYIKRVIGLPGENIEYKNNQLYVNNRPVKEAEGKGNFETADFTMEEVTKAKRIPKDHYFVLGDNRSLSYDSRMFGFVSQDSIIGHVIFRFHPLQTL